MNDCFILLKIVVHSLYESDQSAYKDVELTRTLCEGEEGLKLG